MRALTPQPRELADLARRTQSLALRFDRVRRDTIYLDAPADCPNTMRRVAELAADAETIADLERLVADVRRHGLGADTRPATVLRLVSSPSRPAPVRLSFWQKTMLALGRPIHSPETEVA